MESLALIGRGVEEILVKDELVARLQKGQVLRVKAGFDPSAPDLHLGHTVLLNKMRQFQDLGHLAMFLVGDFTGMIGDPSGRDKTRKSLSLEEIENNTKTYCDQAFKILDSERVEIFYNSHWMRECGAAGMIKLASQYTVARMLERDDFHKRFNAGHSITIQEFLYPLCQGYDSVVMRADVELGGTDQKFNLLLGRQLQLNAGQQPQIALTMPLLEGLDGVQKMSKSLHNAIGITEPPPSMFAKLMSISDTLMWRYYELLSLHKLPSEIACMRDQVADGRLQPRDVKAALAAEIVDRFHGAGSGVAANDAFIRQFRLQQSPDNMPEIKLYAEVTGIPLVNVVKLAGLTSSTSEAIRMIQQNAVRIDGERVQDQARVLKPECTLVLQIGRRRFAQVTLTRVPRETDL